MISSIFPWLSICSDGRFYGSFYRLCSRFVEFGDRRLDDRAAVDVAADDLRHMLGLPTHDLGNHVLAEPGGVEPGRRRPSQIMKMQVGESGRVLGAGERAAKTFRGPWAAVTIGQHRCC